METSLQPSQSLHLSLRELAKAWNTTSMGVKRFIESRQIKLPPLKGKSYRIPSNLVKEILEKRDLQCPKQVVGILNCKGGVGKTVSTHAISTLHSLLWGPEKGYKTLAIDLDFQANLTSSFGISKKVGESNSLFDCINKKIDINDCIVNVTDSLDLIPSNSDMSLANNYLLANSLPLDHLFDRFLGPIKNSYSSIFIDFPPHISQMTTAANIYCDKLLLVTDIDEWAFDGINTMMNHMVGLSDIYKEKIQCDPYIFINKFSSAESRLFDLAAELKQNWGDHMLSVFIPKTSIIKNSINEKRNIWANPKTHPLYESLIDLYLEIFHLKPIWHKKFQGNVQ